MNKLTALVIRAREELTDEFKQRVTDAHPGSEVEFMDIDPRTAKETYQRVVDEGGDVIVVLRPDPLISDLINNGVPCIPILPGDGPLQRVAEFVVTFVDYEAD